MWAFSSRFFFGFLFAYVVLTYCVYSGYVYDDGWCTWESVQSREAVPFREFLFLHLSATFWLLPSLSWFNLSGIESIPHHNCHMYGQGKMTMVWLVGMTNPHITWHRGVVVPHPIHFHLSFIVSSCKERAHSMLSVFVSLFVLVFILKFQHHCFSVFFKYTRMRWRYYIWKLHPK